MGILVLSHPHETTAPRTQHEAKKERHGAMVCTHVSRRKTRNGLHGRLRQRTKGGNYHYRLAIANGTRRDFSLHALNYDEAIQRASELDSIWGAPTQEIALVPMSTRQGTSTKAQKNTGEKAQERICRCFGHHGLQGGGDYAALGQGHPAIVIVCLRSKALMSWDRGRSSGFQHSGFTTVHPELSSIDMAEKRHGRSRARTHTKTQWHTRGYIKKQQKKKKAFFQ